MSRSPNRSLLLTTIWSLLLAVLFGKAGAVFLSSVPAHELTMERRMLREAGKTPSPEHLIHEWSSRSRALYWSPGDADLWFQLGRNLHRVALADVPVPKSYLGEIGAFLSLPAPQQPGDQRELLLTGAIAAYDRAVAANQLVSGARFWRLAARDAIAADKPEPWENALKPAVQKALEFDPNDPAAWRAAGEMALRHDDPDAAVLWLKGSLTVKLDGLERVAETLLTLPEGSRRFGEVIPEKAEAWKRLARYLFTQWRVPSAVEAFDHAMRLAGTTAIRPPEGEAVSDGDFADDSERLLHPWRIEAARGVKTIRRVEQRQLEVVFQRGPANWYHVWQEVAVEPGRNYRLSASLQVDGFSPDETFGVEAVHPYEISLFAANARCYAAAGPSYRQPLPVSDGRFVTVETTFRAPDGVRVLIVRPRRFGGDEKASGTLRIRAVSLRQTAEPEDSAVDPS